MNDEYFRESKTPSQLQQAGPPEQRSSMYGEERSAMYGEERSAAAHVITLEPAPAARSGRPDVRDKPPAGPLKIAYVGPSFNIGGVEQHLCGLARFLNPAVAVLKQCLVTDPARLDIDSSRALPADVVVQVCPKEKLRERVSGMDLVLVWGDSYDGHLDPDGPTIVYIAHGDCWWTRKGLEGSARVVHHVIAVSTRVRQRQCAGFPTTVILNGVDTSRLSRCRAPGEIRAELGFACDDFVIGTVGRMTREKQMHLLIEAVHLLPANFKLLLIGGGPRQSELLTLANAKIPGRYAMLRVMEFLGDYYHAMDAFALASEHEGFALVIAEAMHCGRPVIATEVGCVPEIIQHQINGMIVDPDPIAIGDAAMLIRQCPQWAQGMAAEGQALAGRRFHARQMAAEYGRVLLAIHRSRMAVQRTGAA